MERVGERIKRVALLALVALVGVAAVVEGGSARGSAGPAAVAAVTAGQTCPGRLPPGTRAAVVGTVRNTGDEVLTVSSFDGDAGTPGNAADDFALAYQSGDTNGNGTLDAGETWTYAGSYTLGKADSTNVVGVDAVSAGGTFASDLEACTTDVVQQPVPGVIVGVAPVRGVVLFRVPGSNRFVPLQHATEIPVGSQVDTTKGTVRLISAVTATKTNSAEFFDGLFTIRQRRALRAVTELVLGGGNFGSCRRRPGARSFTPLATRPPKRPVRRLWGSGKGRFQTRGRYSAATIRGTRWLVMDRCDGTLTRVRQGVVLVRDFVRGRSVIVRAGRSYLAAPRR